MMPSNNERRAIDFFIRTHNTIPGVKIVDRQADPHQESPDAICQTDDGRKISLELTSAFPPKGTKERRRIGDQNNMSPVRQIMERKLGRDYRTAETDAAWLVVQVRKTVEPNLLRLALLDLDTDNYEKVIIQCPMIIKHGVVKMGMYVLNEDRVTFSE